MGFSEPNIAAKRIVRAGRAEAAGAGQAAETERVGRSLTTAALRVLLLPSSPSSGSSGGRPNPNGVSLTGFLGS